MRVVMIARFASVELARLLPLGVEELEHVEALEVLLQERVQTRQAGSDATIGDANLGAEDRRRDHEQDDGGQRDQGEPPVEPEHGADDRRTA